MKLVNYADKLRSRVGILHNETIYRISFDVDMLNIIRRGVTPERTSDHVPLAEAKLSAPFVPGKVIAVGRNYAEHAEELGNEVPEFPLMFSKLPSSVIGHQNVIRWHADQTEQVDWEGELAVIIGLRGYRIKEEDAYQHVFGYTVANDVSARDLQEREPQWLRAKGLDTFFPFGPIVVTRDEIPDPHKLNLRTTVNDEEVQSASTGQMVFGIPSLISTISQSFTLYPGDVILTGTPAGVGKGMDPPRFLKDGDTVSVSIDSIGTLTNTCQVISS